MVETRIFKSPGNSFDVKVEFSRFHGDGLVFSSRFSEARCHMDAAALSLASLPGMEEEDEDRDTFITMQKLAFLGTRIFKSPGNPIESKVTFPGAEEEDEDDVESKAACARLHDDDFAFSSECSEASRCFVDFIPDDAADSHVPFPEQQPSPPPDTEEEDEDDAKHANLMLAPPEENLDTFLPRHKTWEGFGVLPGNHADFRATPPEGDMPYRGYCYSMSCNDPDAKRVMPACSEIMDGAQVLPRRIQVPALKCPAALLKTEILSRARRPEASLRSSRQRPRRTGLTKSRCTMRTRQHGEDTCAVVGATESTPDVLDERSMVAPPGEVGNRDERSRVAPRGTLGDRVAHAGPSLRDADAAAAMTGAKSVADGAERPPAAETAAAETETPSPLAALPAVPQIFPVSELTLRTPPKRKQSRLFQRELRRECASDRNTPSPPDALDTVARRGPFAMATYQDGTISNDAVIVKPAIGHFAIEQ